MLILDKRKAIEHVVERASAAARKVGRREAPANSRLRRVAVMARRTVRTPRTAGGDGGA